MTDDKMYQWQMTEPSQDFILVNSDIPEARVGMAIVKIAGCGVCHTDLSFWKFGVKTKHTLPLTLGHEISGTVISGTNGLTGQNVIIPGIPIYRAIYAYDDNVVWAVGRGKILHTANGGLTDTRQHSQFIPTGNKLHQNFPNPFNPGTSLRFDISKSAQVRLLIYDMTGKLVTCLLDKKMNPGSYETGFNAGSLSSGYYLCVLEVDGKASESRKLAFLK